MYLTYITSGVLGISVLYIHSISMYMYVYIDVEFISSLITLHF